MPNGKPGDHPLTDVALHGLHVFSPEIDGLIREIVKIEESRRLIDGLTGFLCPEMKSWQGSCVRSYRA
jgi:hypothetical protein